MLAFYECLSSQEIIWCPSVDTWFAPPWSRVELQESWIGIVIVIHLHYCRLIATSITVIRCTKYGHDILLMTPIITLHNQLVCTCHERQAVALVELFTNVLSKSKACTARRYPPRSGPFLEASPTDAFRDNPAAAKSMD